MTNGKPWGLYARVSSERQADEGLSIEAQLAALREFARQRGYVTCEFVDAGKTAWTEDLTKRPQFRAMLEAARAGELAGVIVTHLDRFSRKLIVTLSVLGELGQMGAGFISLENSAFDFSRPADRLLLAVLGAFAEYYSAELSRKIKRGITTRVSKGLRVGSLPFGFCNGRCVDCKSKDETKPSVCARWGSRAKDTPPMLHPDDAPGVLLAFETYRQSNVSFDDLADALNTAGYRSRTPRGRVLWNRYSAQWLLSNPTYTGIVRHNGKEIAGAHPAIISRELFDEVQAVRTRRHHRSKTYSAKYRVYLFNGLIVCAGCGRKMRAQAWGSNKVETYRCTAKESKHCVCAKTQAHVKADLLDAQFAGIVAQFRLPEDWQKRIGELVNANGKPRDHADAKPALLERLARLKKQFEWGDIGEREYIAKRDEIKRALAECEPPAATVIVNAAEYLQNMGRVWQAATKQERRDMVRALLDEVTCDPDARRLIALRPKPIFRLLLRQVRGLIERDGRFEIVE